MMKSKGRAAAGFGLAVLYAGSLTGCVSSSSPPPDQMARTTLQTAPAEFQLLCADAAAGPSGIERSKILPTESRQLDATTYSVDLNAGGRKFTCVIDNTGKVASVKAA